MNGQLQGNTARALSNEAHRIFEETVIFVKELDIAQQNEFVVGLAEVIVKHRKVCFSDLREKAKMEIESYGASNEQLFTGLKDILVDDDHACEG